MTKVNGSSVSYQGALKTDRTYKARFTEVWMWMDWPDREGEPDTGIDLVARNTDGGFTAIQCKFYAADNTLTKGDIDSFFTASGREPFTDRIIVATTDLWSSNAENALVGQQIPVTRIGIDDLDAMTIDWSQYDATEHPDRVTRLILIDPAPVNTDLLIESYKALIDRFAENE